MAHAVQALEYVRKQLGFPHSATLACGDSGNDIDMLGGKNLAVVVGNAQVSHSLFSSCRLLAPAIGNMVRCHTAVPITPTFGQPASTSFLSEGPC